MFQSGDAKIVFPQNITRISHKITQKGYYYVPLSFWVGIDAIGSYSSTTCIILILEVGVFGFLPIRALAA